MTSKLLIKYNPDLRILLMAFLFYCSAWFGHFLTFESSVILPTWPPSGVAFALIILLGRKAWPGIMIGALLANLMAYWSSASVSPQLIIALSFLIATSQTAEALIGNFLVKKWIGDDYPFLNAKAAFRFLFVTLFMCLVNAGLGAASLYAIGITTQGFLFDTVLVWWTGNVVGILLFTPFIFSARYYFGRFRFSSEKMFETGVIVIFTIGLGFVLRGNFGNPTLERAFPFLILPFLLWLAFRFELMTAMTGVLISSLAFIYITTQEAGPFVLAEPSYSIFLLQMFIGVMSVSTIVLSATVKERLEAQRKLMEFNETLETKVHARTKELNEEILTRKNAEEKLQRTNQELYKRNSELDNFVYSVSHDLRAPIASVLGIINLARKDKEGKMKDVYLDMINKTALQQDHFIREILDQSRNSRLELKREEIFFQPIIEETFNQLAFATATGQSVEKIVTVTQNKPFYCDRWRLKVILNNIISNAIRYRNGKEPVIKVNVEVNGKAARLEIEDNGKGIAKEHLENVYKMFYRATDDGAGSGLGLYIVKETIDKLNGSIKIDSEIGTGTKVRLSIPEVI